ncbi:MAG: hypothetical protein ACYS1C_01465 [Planctomycetota bacterium]|jgi:hypothetical protein
MARVLLVCPSCQKKLETLEENVVREYEYQEGGALWSVLAVMGALVLLLVAASLRWSYPQRIGEHFIRAERLVFLVASVLCCVFFALSFLGGKSLVPATLVSVAWGTLAAVWAGGLIQTVRGVVRDAQGTPLEERITQGVALGAGVYVAVLAGILTFAAAIFFYYRCRDSYSFRHVGAMLFTLEAVAVVAGLLIVFLHVKPNIRQLVPRTPGRDARGAQLLQPVPPELPPRA